MLLKVQFPLKKFNLFSSFTWQITSVWTSPTPFMYLSMYMKKKSRFTPFVAYALKKMAETGIKDGLSKR